MKKYFWTFLFILLIAIALSASQNNPKAVLSKIESNKLSISSRELEYKVYLLGVLPLGKAVFRDIGPGKKENKNLYHLNAMAEGTGVIAKIYPFSVKIDSYLDISTFLPAIFKQALTIKEKTVEKEVSYDQQNNIMRIHDERRSILPGTYEPLSAVYHLRKLNTNDLASFDLNINTNQKNYALKGNTQKDSVQLKGGPLGILNLSAKIFRRDKNPYHQSRINMILLDNLEKTPIYIKVFASGMLITVRLTDIR